MSYQLHCDSCTKIKWEIKLIMVPFNEIISHYCTCDTMCVCVCYVHEHACRTIRTCMEDY